MTALLKTTQQRLMRAPWRPQQVRRGLEAALLSQGYHSLSAHSSTFGDQQPANSLSRSHVAVSLGDRNLVESADKLCKALGKMSLVGNDAKCHMGESVDKLSSLLAKEHVFC